MIRAATEDDLGRVVRAHAAAAEIAVDAGFDAVELHFGHNYLVSALLSPRLNRRTDRFGGSLRNRARLALGIAGAVRGAVGDRIAVTAKLNLDDGVPGGFGLAESIQVGRWLRDDGTLDALELTAGSSLLNPMYLFTATLPFGSSPRDFRHRSGWACGSWVGGPAGSGPAVPGRGGPSVDPARRHHPPGHNGPGDGRGLRLRRPRPGPAARA
jgi:2,4-dienoyl-CoA reductase-like NADH-dependent reductase (Old Yellow Enzyme family)